MAETAESIRADALKELERWNAIRKNGSNDPFWPDGVNLNLVRNHIIYANRRLKNCLPRLCSCRCSATAKG